MDAKLDCLKFDLTALEAEGIAHCNLLPRRVKFELQHCKS